MKNIQKAYEIIYATQYQGAYASLLLKQVDDDYNVALITELVYGTIRNYRYVFATWRQFTETKLKQKVSALLDLGVYMLRFSDKPDYAIVNNIVEISKQMEKKRYTKLVNAVLNNCLKTDPLVLSDDQPSEMALKYSHPEWLVHLWIAHYGHERTLEILKYNLTRNTVTLRSNHHKISTDDLLKMDDRFSKGHLAPEEVYFDGNIFETEYFKKGLVSVQDAASQLVAHHVNANVDDTILDTCSAPGTKAIHIASLRHDKGKLDAVELHESRSHLIRNECARLGIESIRVFNHDARFLSDILDEEAYDKVLVDVPCTGLGVMRGKPEIKMHIKPEDIDSIVILQREIIDSSVKMVKDGGSLIYSTCTINKKENEQQIKYLLNTYPNFKLKFEETIFGYEHQSDSFYIAVLERIA